MFTKVPSTAARTVWIKRLQPVPKQVLELYEENILDFTDYVIDVGKASVLPILRNQAMVFGGRQQMGRQRTLSSDDGE